MIKGMIFAAGLGTRLRPLTDSMPKAMVEVGGRPMLRHVIDRMAAAGVEEIVVNVHHFPDVIKDYLASIDEPGFPRIIISDERDELLETGGGLLRAAPLLADAEAIVVHNADILTDASLGLMIEMHRFRRDDATLLIDPLRESSRRLLFDSDLELRGRINLTSGEVTPPGLDAAPYARAAFGGVHVISPAIFPALASYAQERGLTRFSIVDFYCAAAARMAMRGYVAERPSMWFDIGRPESLAAAREAILQA